MDAGFFKGTSTDQDKRFSDKEAKLLKTLKFPPEFETKVDMRKVNLQVMRPWIAKKVTELVGFEDEVVVEYAMGLLEDSSKPIPDPKLIQINLTGFLTSSTPAFMTALWSLLIEAQESPAGIPKSFVEEKKEEMRVNNQRRGFDNGPPRPRLDELRDQRGAPGGRGRGSSHNSDGTRLDSRGPSRGANDRNGRQRDSGWGARGGRPRQPSRSPPRRYSPPPRYPRSASRSFTPPPRRRRSPSFSPSGTERSKSGRSRSRTPVGYGNRRRRSRSVSMRRSYSRSRTPPQHRRPAMSYSPRERRRSPSASRSRTPPPRNRISSHKLSRSPEPGRRKRAYSPHGPSRERDPHHREKRRRRSTSRLSSPPSRQNASHDSSAHKEPLSPTEAEASPAGELKIKGTASKGTKSTSAKHRSLAERLAEEDDRNKTMSLQQKEQELKEAALRSKLVKSKARKSGGEEA